MTKMLKQVKAEKENLDKSNKEQVRIFNANIFFFNNIIHVLWLSFQMRRVLILKFVIDFPDKDACGLS